MCQLRSKTYVPVTPASYVNKRKQIIILSIYIAFHHYNYTAIVIVMLGIRKMGNDSLQKYFTIVS